jgi:hypothetical protein
VAVARTASYGQVAVAGEEAVGQVAVARYAMGQVGVGRHVLDSRRQDPEARAHFAPLLATMEQWLGVSPRPIGEPLPTELPP